MKTRLGSLRALREKILSDLQGSPVAVLKNTSPYLRKGVLIPMRFQVSKNGGRGGPPPPVMVGTGVPAGPSHVTHLAAHWYKPTLWRVCPQDGRAR